MANHRSGGVVKVGTTPGGRTLIFPRIVSAFLLQVNGNILHDQSEVINMGTGTHSETTLSVPLLA